MLIFLPFGKLITRRIVFGQSDYISEKTEGEIMNGQSRTLDTRHRTKTNKIKQLKTRTHRKLSRSATMSSSGSHILFTINTNKIIN